MTNSISKSDFGFVLYGHGRYAVTYTSPTTGKIWAARVDDMELIDATKNTERPKKKDLEVLKRVCKQG